VVEYLATAEKEKRARNPKRVHQPMKFVRWRRRANQKLMQLRIYCIRLYQRVSTVKINITQILVRERKFSMR